MEKHWEHVTELQHCMVIAWWMSLNGENEHTIEVDLGIGTVGGECYGCVWLGIMRKTGGMSQSKALDGVNVWVCLAWWGWKSPGICHKMETLNGHKLLHVLHLERMKKHMKPAAGLKQWMVTIYWVCFVSGCEEALEASPRTEAWNADKLLGTSERWCVAKFLKYVTVLKHWMLLNYWCVWSRRGKKHLKHVKKLKQVINNRVCMTQSAWGSIWTLWPTWNTGWWQTVECASFRVDKKHRIRFTELKRGRGQATWYVWPRQKKKLWKHAVTMKHWIVTKPLGVMTWGNEETQKHVA